MSPVGRGCSELGSSDLSMRAKVQLVGRLRVAELSTPGGVQSAAGFCLSGTWAGPERWFSYLAAHRNICGVSRKCRYLGSAPGRAWWASGLFTRSQQQL